MWIERLSKKAQFINKLLGLDKQVLMVHGARQVGKTSFIINALKTLPDFPQLKLNLLYPSSFTLDGEEYLGRDFLGRSETGEEFLKNINSKFSGTLDLDKPLLVFVDEVDRHPVALEYIQTLAQFSDKIKFVFTGSNLENVAAKNAATGRKNTFDLYPITFGEFISALGQKELSDHLNGISLKTGTTEYYHKKLYDLFGVYMRIGGMPKIVDAYIGGERSRGTIPDIVKDLAVSIEENVKTILGEKTKLYEYEDVLRKIAYLSMNTLKYSHLQVQHTGRSEAKKLIAKTVGARVAHKIRLFDTERDLSKYILFDCGITNYLLNGADILNVRMDEKSEAILFETFIGTEMIASLITRDDLHYWKSGNKAEIEFLLRSPFIGIDVKARKGDNKSLNSFALIETGADYIVKICNTLPSINYKYVAGIPTETNKRTIPLVCIPHYLAGRLTGLLKEL